MLPAEYNRSRNLTIKGDSKCSTCDGSYFLGWDPSLGGGKYYCAHTQTSHPLNHIIWEQSRSITATIVVKLFTVSKSENIPDSRRNLLGVFLYNV